MFITVMLAKAIDSVKRCSEMFSSTSAGLNNFKSSQKQLIYGASRVAIFSLSCYSWAILHYTNPQTLGNTKIGERKPKVGGKSCSAITSLYYLQSGERILGKISPFLYLEVRMYEETYFFLKGICKVCFR